LAVNHDAPGLFRVRERYLALQGFYEANNLQAEAAWVVNRLASAEQQ